MLVVLASEVITRHHDLEQCGCFFVGAGGRAVVEVVACDGVVGAGADHTALPLLLLRHCCHSCCCPLHIHGACTLLSAASTFLPLLLLPSSCSWCMHGVYGSTATRVQNKHH